MGKLKGKTSTSGDNGMLSYTDSTGAKVQVKYSQAYSTELGILANSRVSFDLITVGSDSIAVSVAPVNKGTISDITIDPNTGVGTGTIFETESGVKYPFVQNYAAQSNFAANQVVTYTLVTVKGVLTAVCLSIVTA
jgi:hypothetical protein